MVKVNLEVRNDFDTGRVANIVQSANKYNSKVKIEKSTKTINLKSIMGMISLSLLEGDEIELTIEGSDENEALAELKSLL